MDLDHIFNFPGETEADIEESLDFYLDNNINILNIFFLNYYPDSHLTKFAHENGYLSDPVYEKIMNNEMIGEQSFMGTVLDEHKSLAQVKIAILYRLINFLPKKTIRWIWKNKYYKSFPTNRYFYYLLSAACEMRGRGISYLLMIAHLSFSGITLSILLHRLSSRFKKREGQVL